MAVLYTLLKFVVLFFHHYYFLYSQAYHSRYMTDDWEFYKKKQLSHEVATFEMRITLFSDNYQSYFQQGNLEHNFFEDSHRFKSGVFECWS